MPFVDLPDPQRPPERQAVRSPALFGLGCDDVDIADLTQPLLEGSYAFSVISVVVCYQDPWSFKVNLIGFPSHKGVIMNPFE
jgi:hypothetical protein